MPPNKFSKEEWLALQKGMFVMYVTLYEVYCLFLCQCTVNISYVNFEHEPCPTGFGMDGRSSCLSLTSTYGSILKIDSSKIICKKDAGCCHGHSSKLGH